MEIEKSYVSTVTSPAIYRRSVLVKHAATVVDTITRVTNVETD